MISVVIPVLNGAPGLADTLDGLVPAAVDGLVREVIVADGGSTDATLAIADGYGADLVTAGPARTNRLNAGAQRARAPWLMFLEPGCVLGQGWERDVAQFMHRVDDGRLQASAGVFRVQIDDSAFRARIAESLLAAGTTVFGVALRQQGLVIPRALYADTVGFRSLAGGEDVEVSRWIGRRRLVRLKTAIRQPADRGQASGPIRWALAEIMRTALSVGRPGLVRTTPAKGAASARMADV